MHIPRIQMHSQMAQINITQTRGEQAIEQPRADMSIQQPKADLSITVKPQKLTIDQSKAWEDAGLMTILKRVKQFAQEGKQAAHEGTGRRAHQGDAMMKIENDGNPIAEGERQKNSEQKGLGMTFIPSHFSVQIDYDPAEVKIDATPHAPKIKAHAQKPITAYQTGKVQTSMKQHQDLQIDVAY